MWPRASTSAPERPASGAAFLAQILRLSRGKAGQPAPRLEGLAGGRQESGGAGARLRE
ncbi:hypothetical protein ARTHRO8AJ_450042 [Arthrobacter sp. 8AJ]|nr:hypothetical protein ARTHRO8AJ_450042 [Arthrobacter sp. 8AJ]